MDAHAYPRLSAWLRCSVLCAFAGVAQAEALYLGGAEYSDKSDYVYLGRIGSLEHDQLQNGWATRLWLDRASYRYTANGIHYRGRNVGLEAGIGYLFGQAPFTGSVFVSALARDTHVSPDDPGNRSQGVRGSVRLSTDLNYQINTLWTANAGASFTPLNHAYWGRLRLMRAISDSTRVGLELSRHGDEHYRATQMGMVLTQRTDSGISWGLKLGYRRQPGEGSSPYVGIELGKSF